MQNTQTAQECLIAEVVEDLDKIVTVITAVADRPTRRPMAFCRWRDVI